MFILLGNGKSSNRGGIKAGLELSGRKLEIPGMGCQETACLGRWDETLHRAYVAIPFGTRAALSGEWRHEASHLEGDPGQFNSNPYRMRTDLLPLRLWFKAGVGDAFLEQWGVRQNARITELTGADTAGHSAFWVTNLRYSVPLVSTRLVGSLSVSNLFDRDFRFQNTDLNGDPKAPLFYPRRTVLLQGSIRF